LRWGRSGENLGRGSKKPHCFNMRKKGRTEVSEKKPNGGLLFQGRNLGETGQLPGNGHHARPNGDSESKRGCGKVTKKKRVRNSCKGQPQIEESNNCRSGNTPLKWSHNRGAPSLRKRALSSVPSRAKKLTLVGGTAHAGQEKAKRGRNVGKEPLKILTEEERGAPRFFLLRRYWGKKGGSSK